jgi:sarcosine oxidase subunit beta
VAIIGGGVHGCSIAWHLAKRGVKAVLFERDYISSGSSGRSAAGLRYQFGTEVNCRLARYNMEKIPQLQEELGFKADLEYDPAGYLWIAYSETQLEQLKKNVALQNSLGVGSVILDPDGIKEVAPGLDVRGMLGASFNEKDGHVNPHAMNFAYADAARGLGADIRTGTSVTGLLTDGHKVRGVRTARGDWETGAIICAVNAWSREVCGWCGLDVPVTPERHQILVTEPVERMKHPMTLCLDDGCYWKQCPNGTFMFGWDNPEEKKDTSFESSWQFPEEVSKRVLAKMPCLAGVRVVRQWTGPYAVTPDEQAIMGKTPVENFFFVGGWSGHGLQFAPSSGRIMSEIVLGEEPFLDVSCFRFSRFEEGCLYPEPACI